MTPIVRLAHWFQFSFETPPPNSYPADSTESAEGFRVMEIVSLGLPNKHENVYDKSPEIGTIFARAGKLYSHSLIQKRHSLLKL